MAEDRPKPVLEDVIELQDLMVLHKAYKDRVTSALNRALEAGAHERARLLSIARMQADLAAGACVLGLGEEVS
jgi:hypothetical protein